MNKIFRLNDLITHNKKKEICVGVNWDRVKKNKFSNLFLPKKEVDLDASLIVYDNAMNLIDLAYYNHLHTKDNAIWHSGDNFTEKSKFEEFSEVVNIKFPLLDPMSSYLFMVLTSYEQYNFSTLNAIKLNIYEGTPYKIEKELILHQLDTSNIDLNKKTGAMLGFFYKKDEEWFFKPLSIPLEQHKVSEIVKIIPAKYNELIKENL